MKRLLLVFLLVVTPFALAQEKTDTHAQSGDVAHGTEKAAAEQAHGEAAHGEEAGTHAPKKIWIFPAWVVKLVNMLLFLGALVYFLRGPVKKAMAERKEAIRQAAAEAKERRAKADQTASEIQARLTAIESEVRAIHERAQAEGERQKRDLIAAAEAEAAKILQAARNEVDNRLKHARHELTEYAGQLAAERAEQILREKINDDDQRRLFQESLKQVAEVQS